MIPWNDEKTDAAARPSEQPEKESEIAEDGDDHDGDGHGGHDDGHGGHDHDGDGNADAIRNKTENQMESNERLSWEDSTKPAPIPARA